MLHTNNQIIKYKVGLLNGDVDALINKSKRAPIKRMGFVSVSTRQSYRSFIKLLLGKNCIVL
jgi:hypothetical protein